MLCLCLVGQSCLTLCNHMDCSLPGSSVHRNFRQEYWGGLPFPPPIIYVNVYFMHLGVPILGAYMLMSVKPCLYIDSFIICLLL